MFFFRSSLDLDLIRQEQPENVENFSFKDITFEQVTKVSENKSNIQITFRDKLRKNLKRLKAM